MAFNYFFERCEYIEHKKGKKIGSYFLKHHLAFNKVCPPKCAIITGFKKITREPGLNNYI